MLIDFGSARGEIASHSKTVSRAGEAGLQPLRAVRRDQPPAGPVDRHLRARRHALSRRHRQAPARCALAHGQGRVRVRRARRRSAPTAPGFLAAIDKALALEVEARPQSIAAWRGELLAPEPVRASWLARTTGGRKNRKKEKEDAEPAAAVPATVPIARRRADATSAGRPGSQRRPARFPRGPAQEAGSRGRSGRPGRPNTDRCRAGRRSHGEARRRRRRRSRRNLSRRSPSPRSARSLSSRRQHARDRAA